MPSASQTDGVGLRLYTDATDSNFPDGQMRNVNTAGTIINNAKTAVRFIAPMIRNCKLSGMILNGKPFTESGFSSSTSMDSLAVIGVDDSLTSALQNVQFDNNKIYGFEYIFYDEGGAGSGMGIPFGIRNNNFDYIQHWDTTAFSQPTFQNMMTGNVGQFFLDRTRWATLTSIQNSLSDGTTDSEKLSMLGIVSSSDVRAYYDDSGNFKAL
jgi:hypothetical protein